MTGIGQREAAAVPQHVGMDRKRHPGAHPNPAEQGVESLRRHRPVPLGHEDVRGYPLFALQAPQRAYLVALLAGNVRAIGDQSTMGKMLFFGRAPV
jgi:hypothetical protein